MVLEEFFNNIFGWALSFSPSYSLFAISFVLTLLSTLAYKFLTDQQALRRLRGEAKDLQKKMKELKDNPDKVMALQKESLEKTVEQMKHSFKPMLFTIVPFILIFNWLRLTFEGVEIGFLGLINSWFWTYLILSIIFTTILRKVLRVH
ncbi:hypothetical protein CL622_02540 [archaeon]|nr:hypothetical protein [archaeon]